MNCCICKIKYGDGLNFHRFPKIEARRQQWLTAINKHIGNFTPIANARICSQHFSKDSFLSTCSGKIYLKANAVPSIFNMPVKTYLKINKPLRECDKFNINCENFSTELSTTSNTSHSETLDITVIEKGNINVHQQQSYIENLKTTINMEENQNNSYRQSAFISKKRTTKFGTIQSSSVDISTITEEITLQKELYNERKINAKLKKKVEILQQRSRRLQKRVTSMSLLLKHLQDRQLLSEGAADML
ncbi:PREDICTED: THAP domain-containing protein 2-like [Cyphomyrmex costatus]|uniref:THAP domain-containing protein 4 n=1 Tax=Cyphomyrmex costatus TaxID=456900 RepID=A0A195CB92_9HYME|nr:PREDICTED: THAP domain-containing protein 2-like [Cyphomyrmex costatus]KYM97471.1 THAP domain-containing protein 4 [Cyphomyrmex costatus]